MIQISPLRGLRDRDRRTEPLCWTFAEEAPVETYELAGPDVGRFRALLELLPRAMWRRAALVPVPFPAWRAFTYLAERLPHPP